MIEELKGEDLFFQDDEIFKKYFCNKEKTTIEHEKGEALANLIKDFCTKLYNEKMRNYQFLPSGYITYNYLENYGYYFITDADRGWRSVINLGEDTNRAFILLVSDILFVHSMYYELENREKLQADFKNRFGDIEYFGCLYYAEIAFQEWLKYYNDNVPIEIINYYEDYLNSVWWSKENNLNWKYNPNTKLFDCHTIEKTKKRINK